MSSVPSAVMTTVVSFVTPPQVDGAPSAQLIHINFGGTNISKYYLEVDGVVIDQYFAYFGSDLNGKWDLSRPGGGGFPVGPNLVVRVRTEHARPFVSDHYARIYYIEIN